MKCVIKGCRRQGVFFSNSKSQELNFHDWYCSPHFKTKQTNSLSGRSEAVSHTGEEKQGKDCLTQNVTNDIKLLQKKDPHFKCDQCDHAASSKFNLTHHIKSVHKDERQFKCDQCDYAAHREGI